MRHIIGIDIGGTKINGIVWDGKKVVEQLTIVTPNNLASFERNLLKLVDFLSAKYKASGIGIGMAGAMDSKKGVAITSPNIPYIKNFGILDIFRRRGYKNLALDNDASCFLRAEMVLGAAKKHRDVFGIIVGTGIGGAMVLDGRLYRGSDNVGGEWGRWIINGKTLEYWYHAYKRSNDFKQLTSVFSDAFANVVNVLSPQCIVVGGTYGQINAAKFLVPALVKAKPLLMVKRQPPKLIISKLKFAGAIGAALLVEIR